MADRPCPLRQPRSPQSAVRSPQSPGPGPIQPPSRRLPAKRVPEAVERWLRLYAAERAGEETFNEFVDRVGTAPFEAAVKDLAMPIEFSLPNLDHFIDWSRAEPYRVERGEGECAV